LLRRNPKKPVMTAPQLAKPIAPKDYPYAESYELEDFHYQVAWRSHSAVPGHHFSTQSGGGYEFHGHASLIANPDARHLDVHASLHDPFGQFVVKTFRQRSSIPVYVLADLSGSMGFHNNHSKIRILAHFAATTAYSAYRTGDPFGFIGCADEVDWDLFLALRWQKGVMGEIFDRLASFEPQGTSVEGLFEAASLIGKRRALIFLISDFHFPLNKLKAIMECLTRHDVVPVVLWSSMEFELPNWGIYRLCDPETGEERCLFMRPRLREKMRDLFLQRHDSLTQACLSYGRRPFFVIDRFVPEAMSRYFF